MGAEGSKSCGNDKPIATLKTGNMLCASARQKINAKIANKTLVRSPLSEKPGLGYEYWGEVTEEDGSKNYYWVFKKANFMKETLTGTAGSVFEFSKSALLGSRELVAQLGEPFVAELAITASKVGIEAAAMAADAKAPGTGLIVRTALNPISEAGANVTRSVVAQRNQSELGQLAQQAATETGEALDTLYSPKPAAKTTVAPTAPTPFGPATREGADEAPYGYSDNMFMYEGAAQNLVNGGKMFNGGFVGGADCPCNAGFIGSAELDISTVKEYADSVNTKTKDDVIDRILAAASGLGLGGEGKDRTERIKAVLAAIPKGEAWKRSTETQRGICTKIAKAINEAYGNKIINEDLPGELICQHVAEIVASLTAGMHSEFLAVYNDVRKVIRNLEILRDSLRNTFAQVKEKMASATDSTLVDQTTTLADLHKIILDEVDRQLQLLRNLLNVTLVPAQRDLAALIGRKKDLGYYIQGIDVKPGSMGFGKVITDILNGLGVTANYALLVDRALKTVGMTMAEYVGQNSTKMLNERAAQKLMGKEMSTDELSEYMHAIDLLNKNFYRKEDIGKAIKGSAEMEDNIAWTDEAPVTGGAEAYNKTPMDIRVANRTKLKNLIFKAFYNRINDIYNNIIESLEKVSKKIGTEIPLSDQLDGFRHIIQRISDDLVRKKDIYYALIGYYNDAMSKSKKDALMSNMKMVASYIDSIVEMEMYRNSAQYFRDIKTQINALIETVDKYSEEIAAKFGSAEEAAPSYEGGDDVTGGEWSSKPQAINRSTRTITDAFRNFDYYYHAAQIKSNLKHSAKELDAYSAKYEKIIASSIADILTRHKETYDRARKYLTDDATLAIPANYAVANSEMADAAAVRKEKTAAVAFLDAQWDARKKFWAAVEAVDTYMRVFTNGLVKNPEDIRDIKSMLDEIEVINDWYNEATGNAVASVFDYFPSFMRNAALAQDDDRNAAEIVYPINDYTKADSKHYYQRIEAGITTAVTAGVNAAGQRIYAAPGNPLLVTMPTRAAKARDQIKKTMMGLSVLKNLISVFVHIGSKFGGQEIRKQVFLTPSQIYNNLVEYLAASAFCQGFAIGDESPAEFALPKEGPANDNFMNDNHKTATLNLADNTVALHNNANHATQETYVNGFVNFGITSGHGTNAAGHDLWFSTFKKRWGVWMRSVLPGVQNLEGFGFKKEDEYFVLILKSLAAKIFTVTGMYDVLDRPIESNSLSAVRMIIGGADESVPKVLGEATELYLRLPLLAQFYRNIFGFDEGENSYEPNDKNKFQDYDFYKDRRADTPYKISMVPDVDGVFSGLIRFIFRKAKFVQNNTYTLDDVKAIVREVNLIHQRMAPKHGENTVMETIHEFVAEINRRYGIVGKSERNKYEQEFGYRYDYAGPSTGEYDRYTEPPAVDYAILPGETDEEVVRPSAAEKMLALSFEETKRKSIYTVHSDHKRLVYNFRCAIDRHFEKANEEYSFKNAIKMTQTKLSKETSDEKRLELVATLVRGIDVHTKTDGLKYVMFHETVVSGLNALSAIHSLLQRFKRRVLFTDLRAIEDKIWEFFKADGNAAASTAKTLGALRTALREYFKDLKLGDNDQTAMNYVDQLLGRFRNFVSEGGQGADQYRLKAVDGAPNNVPLWSYNNGGFADANNRFGTATVDNTGAGIYAAQRDKKVFVHNNITVGAIPANEIAGLTSLLIGQSVDDLHKAHRSNRSTDLRRRAEAFFRFLFDREYVMKELVESVFGISADLQGLVTFEINDGKLYMSFQGIKNLVEEMFLNIGGFIDILRPHIHPDIIQKYTAKTNPGSFYWLQEQLLEKIIHGRPPQNPDAVERPKAGYANLEELAAKLNTTYQMLTREFDHDGSGLTVDNTLATVPVVNRNRTSYDKVFADMIFYDAAKPGSGLRITKDYPDHDNTTYEAQNGLEAVDYLGVSNPFEQLHFSGPLTARTLDTRYIARFKQLYSWNNDLTPNRSALFSFNQLIAKFIRSFFDVSVQKMYGGLIQPFAAGAFNRSIMDLTATYPDTQPAFFFGSDKPDAVKYNTGSVIRGMLESFDDYTAISKIATSFFKYGVYANQSAAERTKLLYRPDNTLFSNQGINALGNATDSTGLYVLFAVHAIALLIHDILNKMATLIPQGEDYANIVARGGAGATDFTNGPTVVNDGVWEFINAPNRSAATRAGGAAGAPAAAGTLRAVLTSYGVPATERTVPYENVIRTLLANANGAPILARAVGIVDSVLSFAAGNNQTLTAASPALVAMTDVAGAAWAQHPDIETLTVAVDRLSFDGEDMNRAAVRANQRHTVIRRAADLNIALASDMLGGGPGDTDARIETFSALLAKTVEIAAAVHGAALDAANSRARFNILIKPVVDTYKKVPEIYATRPIGEPKIILEHKHAHNVWSTQLDQTITRAANDGGYLRLVTHDEDAPFIGRNPWGHLQGGPMPDDPLNPGNPKWPANRADIINFGRRWDPDSEHVLFTSLAVILRNILSSRGAQNTAATYLVDNIADVNTYMKEKMRANLPGFKFLLQELNNRCTLLKRFLSRGELNVERSFGMIPGGHAVVTGNPWPWKLQDPAPGGTMASHDAKTRFTGILDSIQKGTIGLIQACEQTLREVGDEPKYFETGQGSIKDYKQQNGYEPFMPLSSTLAILKNINATNTADFLPFSTLGDTTFKFAYGTRLTLAQPKTKPLIEHVPGWSGFVSSYNLLADGKNQIDTKKAEAFMSAFVRATRFIYESKFVKGNLTPHMTNIRTEMLHAVPFSVNRVDTTNDNDLSRMAVSGSFVRGNFVVTEIQYGSLNTARSRTVGGVAAPANEYVGFTDSAYDIAGVARITNVSDMSIIADHHVPFWRNNEPNHGGRPRVPIPAYSVTHPLVDTVALTESSFRDDKYKAIVTHLLGEEKDSTSLEIQNIIDLNIVPINVHALMREVPLVNLYNYAYSFDRLIIELYYGLQNENARKLISELCAEGDGRNDGSLGRVTTAKDMLVQLLLNPYKDITKNSDTGYSRFPGENLYEKFGKSMLVGATGNELGRPKFLSDQLFNKALFGEVYMHPSEYNEVGPQASFVFSGPITEPALVGFLSRVYRHFTMRLASARYDHVNARVFARDTGGVAAEFSNIVASYMIKHPNTSFGELQQLIANMRALPATPFAGLDDEYIWLIAAVAVLITKPILDTINFGVRKRVTAGMLEPYVARIALALQALRFVGHQAAGTSWMGLPDDANGHITTADDAVAFLLSSLTIAPANHGAIVRGALPADNAALTGLLASYNLGEDWTSNILTNPPTVLTPQMRRWLFDDYARFVTVGNAVADDYRVFATAHGGVAADQRLQLRFDKFSEDLTTSLFHRQINTTTQQLEGPAEQSTRIHWIDTVVAPATEESEPGAVVEPDNANVFNPNQVKSADVAIVGDILQTVGRLRFDSVFVRNLIFIVNLYRSVRLKLSKDLTYNRDVILKSAAITRSDTTEFSGNVTNTGRFDYSADPRYRRYLY